ncbi:hypothetical protein ACRAWD_28810 [Caulobacter segnis]
MTRVAREVGTEGKLGGQARGRRRPAPGRTSTDIASTSVAANLTGAGAEHRRGDHGRRQRRPVQEDHRRREGRDPGAEDDHQRRWSTS